ncbi:secE/sec61-gamma protein transport protein [Striga asiatica]|uniref:SecE/sec61-gamma protein transport protein n=1 Tax=Striga asiatica TaxID=4170 RepID=A0A5A7PXL8_STRAF|nr:secE/sec61-gamma protein transport protein [Striga asiatica]
MNTISMPHVILEPNRGPPVPRHDYRVPLLRVHEIIVTRVPRRVEVPQPPPDREEREPVEVHRVVDPRDEARALKHHLDVRPVPHEPCLRSPPRHQELNRLHVRRVVELEWWGPRETRPKHPGHSVEVRLEHVDPRCHEADVVHARRQAGPIGPCAAGCGPVGPTGPRVDRDGREDPLADFERDRARVVFRVEASDAKREVLGGGRVVEIGKSWEAAGPVGGGAGVADEADCGGIVEIDPETGDVGSGSHVIAARGLVGEEEAVEGLPRTDGDVGPGQGLGVAAVGADHGEVVAGDAVEHDLVHAGVDQPEKVCLV